MTTPTASSSKKPAATPAITVKRFHFWVLSGKGYHVGRFPIADGIEPDEYCELHYNDKGVCVQIREFIKGYDQPLVRRPVFDAKGRMQYSDRDGPDEGTHLRNSYEYGPDGLLRARREAEREGDKLRWRIVSTYDANGWAREQKRYEADGKQTDHSVFEVDNEGYFTKETKYYGGVLKGHYVFRRDKQHREVAREWYDAKGKLLSSCTTRYGAHDLPEELLLKNPDGSLMSATHVYDAKGKTVSVTLKDGDGNVIEEQRMMPGGVTWKRSSSEPPENLPKNTGSLGVPVHRYDQMSDERAAAVISAGRGHFEQGNFIEALPMFQMAAMKYPRDPYFPYAMGLCSLKLHRFEAALIYYKQALELDPNHAASIKGIEIAKQAMPYMRTN